MLNNLDNQTIYIFNLTQLKKIIQQINLKKSNLINIIFGNYFNISIHILYGISIIDKKQIKDYEVNIYDINGNNLFGEKKFKIKGELFEFIKNILEKNGIKYSKERMYDENELNKIKHKKIIKLINKITKNINIYIKNKIKIGFVTNSGKIKYFGIGINEKNGLYKIIDYFENKWGELSGRFISYGIGDDDKKIGLPLYGIGLQIYKHLKANGFKDILKK